MDTFTSFLAVAAVAVLVPGPDTFVVLRTSLTEGARAGTWAAAGSATGNLVWGAASVLGVAALLHTSATAFSALKLLGAAAAAQRPRGQRDGRRGVRGARRPARARKPLSRYIPGSCELRS